MMEINGIGSGVGLGKVFPSNGANGTEGAKSASSSNGSGNFFGELVGKVNDLQSQADNKIRNMMTGDSKELHEVMIAVEKAGISFQFLTQVRNKAVEAYQEVMRMQV
jgi:flagellar hook-basal body complex protein FliE